MGIYSEPLRSADGSNYCNWLLFEQGGFTRPLCILSHHEMTRLLRAFVQHSPDDARQIIADETEIKATTHDALLDQAQAVQARLVKALRSIRVDAEWINDHPLPGSAKHLERSSSILKLIDRELEHERK